MVPQTDSPLARRHRQKIGRRDKMAHILIKNAFVFTMDETQGDFHGDILIDRSLQLAFASVPATRFDAASLSLDIVGPDR